MKMVIGLKIHIRRQRILSIYAQWASGTRQWKSTRAYPPEPALLKLGQLSSPDASSPMCLPRTFIILALPLIQKMQREAAEKEKRKRLVLYSNKQQRRKNSETQYPWMPR